MTAHLITIRDIILNDPDFVKATFSGQQRGQALRWERLLIRPVLIKNERHLQFSFFDETQNITKNYTRQKVVTELDQILALPFRHFHVYTRYETIQINLTKKGKAIVSRKKSEKTRELSLTHDRQKNTVLSEGEDIPFLRAVGIMRQDGRVKADKRSKFQQINAFLQLLADIEAIKQLPEPIHMVDFGCGSAYLTFAAYHYLYHILGKNVHIVGVDLKEALVQKNQKIADQLGWVNVTFVQALISDYQASTPPDIVVALHACDTATDDALAQGVLWQSQVIIVAPCCHHDLQVQLREHSPPAAFAPVMRYGLLHERQADILTDTFRALILRMMGYRVGVVEFIAPDHTPKNLLLRAIHKGAGGQRLSAEEYVKLKEFWQVTPHLHKLLASELAPLIQA